MKKYIILFVVILFTACQQKQKQEKIIDSIDVLYYNGLFDRIDAVGCDEIVYRSLKNDTLKVLEDDIYVPQEAVILDTTITKKSILQKIALELDLREIIKNDFVDARMKCYITYENGQRDSLCIGNNPIYGLYNNIPVKLSGRLIYLIRENCGFYKWIGIDQMKYFDELNDLSFKRKKVKSRFGEEY